VIVMAGLPVEKVVAVIDLSRYSDIGKELEQHLGVEAVAKLNGQVQSLIKDALADASIQAARLPYKNTGDGAIIILDTAEQGSRFAEALHRAAHNHNLKKVVPLAQRHFRVGLWTGPIILQSQETADGQFVGFDFAGTCIANAVRLEGACKTGEVLIGAHTWGDLPKLMRRLYGDQEVVMGKRNERFPAHRRRVVDPAPWDDKSGSPAGKKGNGGNSNHISELIALHRRRLQLLEKQAAAQGLQTPPHVTIEIEDIRRIIVDLEGSVS
jgi:class 3 adenylate cyclase